MLWGRSRLLCLCLWALSTFPPNLTLVPLLTQVPSRGVKCCPPRLIDSPQELQVEKAMASHYSCLENPMDGGAWKAAVHGVAEGRTRLNYFTFTFSLSCIGEGNGNPLQYSCLENPRDRGAWWAAVYGVAQSQTRLKRLSSSSSSRNYKRSYIWLRLGKVGSFYLASKVGNREKTY